MSMRPLALSISIPRTVPRYMSPELSIAISSAVSSVFCVEVSVRKNGAPFSRLPLAATWNDHGSRVRIHNIQKCLIGSERQRRWGFNTAAGINGAARALRIDQHDCFMHRVGVITVSYTH